MPTVSVNSTAWRVAASMASPGCPSRALDTAANSRPPANAATKPFPPIATAPCTRAAPARGRPAPRRWVWSTTVPGPRRRQARQRLRRRPRPRWRGRSRAPRRPPRPRANRLLGRHDREEERDEWRRDAVVQAALDVECSPDPDGHGAIRDDGETERGVGRCQDRRDQRGDGPGDAEDRRGEDRAERHRQRQADAEEPSRAARRPPGVDRSGPSRRRRTGGSRGSAP